ncbi:MAG: AAA family ATPase [Chloroflexota bacterium]
MAARRRGSRSPGGGPDLLAGAYIRSIALERDRVRDFGRYPFSVPAIRDLHVLDLHPHVTFFVGENGVGKSTLIEAVAVAAGFNTEGGSKNFSFETNNTTSELNEALRLVRGMRRERDGFFLRAESFYNVATEIDAMDADDDARMAPRLLPAYGGRSLHAQSHGESFMALALTRFRGQGLYILDEPEAALSPSRLLSLLVLIDQHVKQGGSQFLIATHSPILMAYPKAIIYHLTTDRGIEPITYEETEHFRLTRDFLNNRETYLRELFSDEPEETGPVAGWPPPR